MNSDKIRDFIFKHKIPLLIVSVILIIVLIIICAVVIIDKTTKTATIDLRFAPATATATINGKKYNNGTHNIEPGTYTIEIEQDGFIKTTETFIAEKDKTTKVFILLESETGDNWWLNDTTTDPMILGSIVAELANKKGEEFKEKNPIIKSLPIKIEYFSEDHSKYIKYTINYKLSEDKESFTLTITDYTGGNYNAALNNLKRRGYNPEDFKIEYIDSSSSSAWGKAI